MPKGRGTPAVKMMATTQNILIGAQTFDISAHLYAGSGSAANAATTNGNTKLTITNESTVRNNVSVVGTGATSVTSDANGKITINSADTTYSFTDGENSFTVTPSGGTAQVVEVTPSLENSATNSFTDGIDSYFKKVVSSVVPVQAGSGTPSPTNVRAISGFTECTVIDFAENILNAIGTDTSNGYVNGQFIALNGTTSGANTYNGFVSEYCLIANNKTYTISGISGGSPSICFYDDNKLFISGINYSNRTTFSFTTPQNARYFRASIPNTQINDAQVELGTTATSHKTYKTPTTATISFGSAGTVYGGEVDLTTGVLTVTFGYVDLGSLTYTMYVVDIGGISTNLFRSSLVPNIKTIASSSITPSITCSDYPTKSMSTRADKCVSQVPNSGFVDVLDTTYTDTTTFKTAMNGVQLVYELATPQEYQLTPAQLRSLVGANRLTSSTGEVTEVEYITNETIAYVDDKVEDSTFVFTLSNVPYASLTTANTDITQYSSATVANIKAAINSGKMVVCRITDNLSSSDYFILSMTVNPNTANMALFELRYNNKYYVIRIDLSNNKILSGSWGVAASTTSIVTSTGTSSISLDADTKYQLTAGGASVIFKTPKGIASSDIFTKASSATDMPAHSYYYDTSTGVLTIKLDSGDIGDASRLWITMVDYESPGTVMFESSVSLVDEGIFLRPIISSCWVSPVDTCVHRDDTTVFILFKYIYTLESYIINMMRGVSCTNLKDEYDGHEIHFYIYVTK